MRIEFFGHQGSGKSTCAKVISDRTGIQRWQISGYRHADGSRRRQGELVVDRVRGVMRRPGLLVTAAQLSIAHRDQSELALGFALSRLTRTLDGIGEGLIDEGPRHILCGRLAYGRRTEIRRWAGRFAKYIPPVDFVVHLSCAPEVARMRIADRDENHPLAQVDEQRMAQHVKRYHEAATFVSGGAVASIETTDLTSEQVADEVMRALGFFTASA